MLRNIDFACREMFYYLAIQAFLAWMLYLAIMAAESADAPNQYGARFGLRSVLLYMTVAAILLGLAAVLTRLVG